MPQRTKFIEGSAEDHSGRQPYIDNYPPLAEWLEKKEAFCIWQKRIGDNLMLEAWNVGGVVALIEVFSNGHGWNIFTTSPTNKTDEAFKDAEDRIGAWKRAADGIRRTVPVGG